MPRCIREYPQLKTLISPVSTMNNLAINCTSEPYLVRNNDMGMFNWTGVDGVDPLPYATAIRDDILL